jgi:exopolyphosphatase/guanosine-5'-triphosphate,3'-diphosphate pyrophosphatase
MAEEAPVPLAVMDVGTNSTRLLVAEVRDRHVGELAREMVITRLGRGVDRTRRFDPFALQRTLQTLADYRDMCVRLGVRAARLVATSATRDAANRSEFLDGVRALFGAEPEVLTGEQEAAAAYLGATYDLPGTQRTLVIDLGGGSTEFILGTGRPEALVSVDIGCVRLTERHVRSDPPTAEEAEAVRADVRHELGKVTAALDPRSAGRVVGVAGTVTTVTALALDLQAYERRLIHRATIPASAISAVAARLTSMTVAERGALPNIASSPSRAGGRSWASAIVRASECVRVTRTQPEART